MTADSESMYASAAAAAYHAAEDPKIKAQIESDYLSSYSSRVTSGLQPAIPAFNRLLPDAGKLPSTPYASTDVPAPATTSYTPTELPPGLQEVLTSRGYGDLAHAKSPAEVIQQYGRPTPETFERIAAGAAPPSLLRRFSPRLPRQQQAACRRALPPPLSTPPPRPSAVSAARRTPTRPQAPPTPAPVRRDLASRRATPSQVAAAQLPVEALAQGSPTRPAPVQAALSLPAAVSVVASPTAAVSVPRRVLAAALGRGQVLGSTLEPDHTPERGKASTACAQVSAVQVLAAPARARPTPPLGRTVRQATTPTAREAAPSLRALWRLARTGDAGATSPVRRSALSPVRWSATATSRRCSATLPCSCQQSSATTCAASALRGRPEDPGPPPGQVRR